MTGEETKTAECIKCAFAEWQRTAGGRVKPKACGRCVAIIPEPISLLCSPLENRRTRKNAIWPDYQGRCDLFEPIRVEGEQP